MKKYSHFNEFENVVNEIHIPVVPLASNISVGEKVYQGANAQVPVSVYGLICTSSIQNEEFSAFMDGVGCMKQGDVASWNFYNRRKSRYETIYIGNPLRYDDLEQFREKTGEGVLSPKDLPKNYFFKHGYISHYPSSEYAVKLKRRENEEWFKIVDVCNYIQNYGIVYSNGVNSIIVSVERVAPNYQVSNSLQEEESRLYDHIELTRVNKNLGMYRVLTKGGKYLVSENGQVMLKDMGGSQELLWLENKTTLVKIIVNAGSEIRKNELISMARNMAVIPSERQSILLKM